MIESEQREWPATVLLRLLPPVLFVGFAATRIYIEADILSDTPKFSLLVVVHHVSWMLSEVLCLILLAHIILRRRVTELLWMMYGGILMAIPPLYAAIAGSNLKLDYLRGGFTDIGLDILTFCALSDHNRPLCPEIVAIFVSMLVVGRIMGHSWRRGLVLALVAHLIGMLVATQWVGFSRGFPGVLITLASRFPKHGGLGAACLTLATVLSLTLVFRSGLAACVRRTLWRAADAALAGGVIAIVGACLADVSPHPFDRVVVGIPAAVAAFIAALAMQRDSRTGGWGTWTALSAVAGANVFGWTVILRSF